MSAQRNQGSSEKSATTANGIVMLLLLIGLGGLELFGFASMKEGFAPIGAVVGVVIAFIAGGFFMLQPNEAGVLPLFGAYLGTERAPGLRWTLPWNGRRRISV